MPAVVLLAAAQVAMLHSLHMLQLEPEQEHQLELKLGHLELLQVVLWVLLVVKLVVLVLVVLHL